jgi:hypothetical protein
VCHTLYTSQFNLQPYLLITQGRHCTEGLLNPTTTGPFGNRSQTVPGVDLECAISRFLVTRLPSVSYASCVLPPVHDPKIYHEIGVSSALKCRQKTRQHTIDAPVSSRPRLDSQCAGSHVPPPPGSNSNSTRTTTTTNTTTTRDRHPPRRHRPPPPLPRARGPPHSRPRPLPPRSSPPPPPPPPQQQQLLAQLTHHPQTPSQKTHARRRPRWAGVCAPPVWLPETEQPRCP